MKKFSLITRAFLLVAIAGSAVSQAKEIDSVRATKCRARVSLQVNENTRYLQIENASCGWISVVQADGSEIGTHLIHGKSYVGAPREATISLKMDDELLSLRDQTLDVGAESAPSEEE